MDTGPAPTMVYDWITPQAFFIFISLAVFATVVTIFVKNLRDVLAEKRAERNELKEIEALYNSHAPGDCFIEVCLRPGTIPVHTIEGIRYVCHRHEAGVYDWIAYAYDQSHTQMSPSAGRTMETEEAAAVYDQNLHTKP